MSKIEWTEETWNPVTGCTKVSPGCDNCYAEKMSNRLAAMGVEKYRGAATKLGWTGRVRCHRAEIDRPLKWKKPRLVFMCSMSDLFHHDVSEDFILGMLITMASASARHHTYQILTKRPERMLRFFEKWRDIEDVYLQWFNYSGDPREVEDWPPPNVWFGVTAETQTFADRRIPKLLELPASVRFVSFEPLLGPLDIREYCGETGHETGGVQGWTVDRLPIDWAIFGCESGPNRRRCPLEWVRESVDHCQNNGIKVFIKQLDIDGRVEKDINKFPTDLQIREWPEEP